MTRTPEQKKRQAAWYREKMKDPEYRKARYTSTVLWRSKNQQKYKALRKRVSRQSRQRRDWMHAIKRARGCLYCSETDPICLDFHHRNAGEKKFSIGTNASRTQQSLQDEIDKCDVVCANCHRKLEWQKTHRY